MAIVTIKRRLMALEKLTAKPAPQLLSIAFARDDGVLTNREGQPIERQSDKRYLIIHRTKAVTACV